MPPFGKLVAGTSNITPKTKYCITHIYLHCTLNKHSDLKYKNIAISLVIMYTVTQPFKIIMLIPMWLFCTRVRCSFKTVRVSLDKLFHHLCLFTLTRSWCHDLSQNCIFFLLFMFKMVYYAFWMIDQNWNFRSQITNELQRSEFIIM